MPKSGIYAIQHTPSGRQYIGSSVNIDVRIRKHFTALRKGQHHSVYLQRVWNSYPEADFVVRTILFCEPENLKLYEQLCIDRLVSNLNGAKNANSPVYRGQKLPVEWVVKVAAAAKARYANGFTVKHPPRSVEYRSEVSKKSKQRWQDPQAREQNTLAIRSSMTEEECKKRSERSKLLWADPEYRAKAVNARKGRSSNKGYKCTPEQVENRRRNARIYHTKRRFGASWKEHYVRLYPDLAGDVNA
jgi:group I intron endonuclease